MTRDIFLRLRIALCESSPIEGLIAVRRVVFGVALALSMCGALVGSEVAAAAPPATLTSEILSGGSSSGNTFACPTPTYSATGTATGPYPGTFTEAGSWNPNTFPPLFSATFTINSGTSTVTGTKTFGFATDTISCGGTVGASLNLNGASYTATIHTPAGNFEDQGVTNVQATITGSAATVTESFTSAGSPTSKNQCKHGGWMNYPQFKSQGDCVSFVATGGSNAPGNS